MQTASTVELHVCVAFVVEDSFTYRSITLRDIGSGFSCDIPLPRQPETITGDKAGAGPGMYCLL